MVLNKKLVKYSRRGPYTVGIYRTTEPMVPGIERIIDEEAIILHEEKGALPVQQEPETTNPPERTATTQNAHRDHEAVPPGVTITGHLPNGLRKMPSQQGVKEVHTMNEKNRPYKKAKNCRFQISLFKCNKIVRTGGDTTSELIMENIRVCVQYSRYNRNTCDWERQSIWCTPEELRDLGNALDGLTGEPLVEA